MKLPNRLVWVDLETTGLDPEKDLVIECALVITDNRLNEVATFNWLVKPPAGLPALHAAVLKMHGPSGLLSSIHLGHPIHEVDVMAAGLVYAHAAAGGPICGSTPQFDKRFIDRHMPAFARCFNHRVFDVSTLKLAGLIQSGKTKTADEGQEPAHRALSDIRYSIACTRELLKLEAK